MFSGQNLQLNRGSSTANAQGSYTATAHTYIDMSSTVATIKSYFPDYLGQGVTQEFLHINDLLYIFGSDNTNCCQILSLAPFTVGADLFSGASGLSILPPIAPIDLNGAVISGDTFSLENADATHPGIITTGTQTFSGVKTFANGIVAPGTTYTTGAPIAATDANGLVINNTTSVIQAELADATHAGIVSATTQTFGGTKTFSNATITGNASTNSIIPLHDTDTLNIGGTDFDNSNTQINGFILNGASGINFPGNDPDEGIYEFIGNSNGENTALFGGAFTTPISVVFTFIRMNGFIFLGFARLSPVTVDNAQPIFASAAIPSLYCPVFTIQAPIIVTNNGVLSPGNITVANNGDVFIYTGSGTGNFTAGAPGGFGYFGIFYQNQI